MKFLLIVLFGFVLAGGFTTSCSHYPITPPDTTKCDTCHLSCDTCNLNRDSLSHAFEWTEYTIDGEASLTGCWIFGDTDIRVVGNYLYKFNGTAFLKLSAYNVTRSMDMGGGWNGFNMFGFDSDDYWLVSGSIAYHSVYDTRFEEFRPGTTNACWGPSSDDMFIVGNGGQIHHYDGTKFTDMISGATKNLRKVWGTSHNNVWASGWNQSTGESVLLHFDGTSWVEQDLSKLGDIGVGKHALISVWTVDSAGHQITVTGGSFIYRTTDNGTWYNDSGKVANRLNDGGYAGLNVIRGNSSTDFMVEGGGGFVSHWNGKTWFFYDKLFDWDNASFDTYAFDFSGNTACMVGTKNGQAYVAVGKRKK